MRFAKPSTRAVAAPRQSRSGALSRSRAAGPVHRVVCLISAVLVFMVLLGGPGIADMRQVGQGEQAGQTAQGEQGEQPPVSDRYDRVLFASVELAEVSIFGGSGFKHSLSGNIEAPGPVAMLMTNLGATRERWQAPDGFTAYVPRMTQITRLYFGRQDNTALGFMTIAAGMEIRRAQELGDDALPRWRQPRMGAALIAELWREAPLRARPARSGHDWTRRPFLTHATIMAGSAAPSLWARLATGPALTQTVFAGPEASVYLEPGYQELRLGAHVTGFTLGPLTLRLAGGVVMPRGGRSDVYIGLQGHILR